ncbi:MAG: four helix bundle protein [Microgenomates group bacterium]
MNQSQKAFDLEKRTVQFSENIINLCQKVSKYIITINIVSQLLRSATSIGANYHEANGASSKKDFKNKIFICKKESKETMYWLQLLSKADNGSIAECRRLWKEAYELTRIFTSIVTTMKKV